MKTLYLVRHAKSDQGIAGIADIDRPLNTRGYRDADTMSKALKEKKLLPDLIITSPAVRAFSTALIFCRNFNLNPDKIIIKTELYESSVKNYLQVIKQADDRFSSIMLFGHNPIMSDLANSLSSSFTEDVPTCSVVCIKSNCKHWENIEENEGELLFYDFPKKNLL